MLVLTSKLYRMILGVDIAHLTALTSWPFSSRLRGSRGSGRFSCEPVHDGGNQRPRVRLIFWLNKYNVFNYKLISVSWSQHVDGLTHKCLVWLLVWQPSLRVTCFWSVAACQSRQHRSNDDDVVSAEGTANHHVFWIYTCDIVFHLYWWD